MKLKLSLQTLLLALCAFATLHGEGLKGQNSFIDGEEQYRLYVKVIQTELIDIEDGKVQSFNHSRSSSSDLLNTLNQFSFSQLVELDETERNQIRSGRQMRSMDGSFSKSQYSGLIELENASAMTKEELLSLAEELERYPNIEYCELVPLTPYAPPGASLSQPIVPPASPLYEDKQFYLFGVDATNSQISGIYADYAWDLGITGEGVMIADIEWGWDYQHEDFAGQNMIDALHTTNEEYNDHGTSVCGEMFAADNGFGVTGAVHGADGFMGFSEITQGRPAAILKALDSLEAGDVLVYEMQTGGKNGEFVPADYSQSVWDLTKTATEAGIIVVAAAGNGSQNLDESYYASYMNRGDNGSIIVGAGSKVGRNTVGFSTYGSRVDLCGIGDWSIYSTGYGDLYGSGHNSYTSSFSGTSSSTPIVASAAVAVQSYAKKELGMTITPLQMRELLIATGTPQGTGGHIGPLPNIKAAIEKLDADFGSVENFQLTVINGSGSGEYREGATVDIIAKDSMGYAFVAWTGDTDILSSASTKTTTVTMPALPVSLTATYEQIVLRNLTVNNGSGSGDYPEGEIITITAIDSIGYIFQSWVGDTEHLSSSTSQSADVTIPTSDISVTATYKEFNLKLIDQSNFSVQSSSSEWSDQYGNGQILDNSDETFWHSANEALLPAEITFELTDEHAISGFAYLPRQDSEFGSIKEYKIEVSSDGTNWTEIKSSQFSDTKTETIVEFEEITANVKFVKFKINSSYSAEAKVSLADFNLYGAFDATDISSLQFEVNSSRISLSSNSIQLQGFDAKNGVVTILGLNGQVLLQSNVNFANGNAQIDLSNLSRGVMIMQLTTESVQMNHKLVY